MAAVFLMGVFWKRCTTTAANIVLTAGTMFSIGIGIIYLWVVEGNQYMHFGMLSFLIFCVLIAVMVIASLIDKDEKHEAMKKIEEHTSVGTIVAWTLLCIVMVAFYVFFNSH